MSLFGFLASQISPIRSLSERPLRLSPSRLKRQFDTWGGAREDAETYAAEKNRRAGWRATPRTLDRSHSGRHRLSGGIRLLSRMTAMARLLRVRGFVR